MPLDQHLTRNFFKDSPIARCKQALPVAGLAFGQEG
jgi:hypothetical protein